MSSSSKSAPPVALGPPKPHRPHGQSEPGPTRALIPRLLPRPTWPTVKRKTATVGVSAPRACRVPMCPNKKCKLMSHRLFDPTCDKKAAKMPRKEQPPKQVQGTIGRDGVDGLPQIPVDDPLNPELRVLFHHFFDTVFDRLAGTFRGPLLAPGYKHRMLEVALTNQAYCMGIITQAQTDTAISRGTFAETRESLGLYTQLISIFRNQLAASTGQGPPNPMHLEVALLVLCILLSYNVTRGRISELNMNWTALRHLVNIRGGVHNLTVALAYVVHVDRACATMMGSQPTYVTRSTRLHQSNRPPWATYSPGFVRLETSQTPVIFGPVLEHCLNTCELLTLYEAFHQPPPPEQHAGLPPSRPSPEYLYYLRDTVDERFAILYGELMHHNTMSKCILLAIRIVEYPVTWANYVPSLTMDLCAELCGLLRNQDLFERWSSAPDLLTWILFVLLTSPWPFAGREWAVTCLKGIVGAKYGAAKWPTDWWKQELTTLKAFAWSDARYSSNFHQVCRELEAGTVSVTVTATATATAATSSRSSSNQSPSVLRKRLKSEPNAEAEQNQVTEMY